MKKIWFLTTLLIGGLLLTGCNKTVIENPQTDSWEQFITYEKVDSWYIYKYETTIFEDEHIYYPLTFSIFSEKLLSNSDIKIEINEDLDWKHWLLELKTSNWDFVDAFWKDYHLISIWPDLTMYCQSSEKNNRKYLFLQWKLPWFDESCLIDMWNYDAEPFNSEPFWFKLSVFPWGFWIRKLKSYDELTDKCKESITNNHVWLPLDTIYWAIEPANENFNCMVTWSWKPTNLLSMDLWQKKRDEMLEAWIFHNVEEGTFTVSDWFYSYTFMDKNLWANVAWTGEDSYWCFFQWWNDYCFPWNWEIEKSSKKLENPEIYWPDNHLNNPIFITPKTKNINTSRDYWVNDEHNDDLRWWALNEWKLIHEEPDFRRWPCPEWYHVPTYDELRGMLWAFYYYYRWIWDDPNNHSFEDEVLIPYAGSRDFEYWWSWWQWEHRWLWSSTPSRNWNLAHSQALYSSHSENDLSRGAWFSLRCFKD